LARLSRYDKILALLFVLSLPLVNPWVRGDGVGYYAFGRTLLIQHNLDFKEDWLRANPSFRMGRTDPAGNLLPMEYTFTGHLDNHFSIGPAILWSPFLLIAHFSILFYDALGGRVPADGFAKPYIVSMAFGTAFYGFLSLWISFRLARKYLSEQYAFLATLGICTSIHPGPIPCPHLPSLCLSGIGISPAMGAPGPNGSYWEQRAVS
jgi:hypothetical protein